MAPAELGVGELEEALVQVKLTASSYRTTKTSLIDIWTEVRQMKEDRRLPGLVEGAGEEFIVLVDAPTHKHRHPRLVM